VTTVLQQSEADRIRADEAKAEELRRRNVIEAAGWTVTRVSVRNGKTHHSIVRGDDRDRRWYGRLEELA
jgi:hypothetical protein